MDGNAIDWEAAAGRWIDQEAGEARMPEGELIAEIGRSDATRSARWPRRAMASCNTTVSTSTPRGPSGSRQRRRPEVPCPLQANSNAWPFDNDVSSIASPACR